MGSAIEARATEATRRRYDRLARVDDRLEAGAERRFAPWCAALWERVREPLVPEVGVGTGKNLAYYSRDVEVSAVDLSPRMLERARQRATRLGIPVELREADAQALPFPDASFDTAVATFVFCSVPDPVRGLRGLRRVLKPGAQLLLLEHVLSRRPVLRPPMQLIIPIVVRVMGVNIDRDTVENVRRAGFVDVQTEDLWLGTS